MKQKDRLERYRELVARYAEVLDLSSPKVIEGFGKAIERSRAYLPYLAPQRVLDLGSGVGLPGVVIAVERPDLTVVLCEVRRRRAAFLARVASELGLENATVYNGDVRSYRGPAFDTVVSQAVGRLFHTYTLCEKLLAPSWTLLSVKGSAAEGELEEFVAKVAACRSARLEPLGGGAALAVLTGGSSPPPQKFRGGLG